MEPFELCILLVLSGKELSTRSSFPRHASVKIVGKKTGKIGERPFSKNSIKATTPIPIYGTFPSQ